MQQTPLDEQDPSAAIVDAEEAADDARDRERVEREREKLKDFVAGLSADDIKSGNWFSRLLTHALATYTEKVDWRYFQEKYAGVPADGVVDQRIKMASRYAAIEGALSAGAYSAVVVVAAPAGIAVGAGSALVDLAFTTQLQLRLAYDISVLYQVPIDTSDPDDLWKLIRVAFTIKTGELAQEGLLKAVPVIVRPLVKRFYSKGVLSAARGLPVVGQYLLQRNVIKIGIPVVGVPLAALLNRYSTLIAGRHARAVFRNDARLRELGARLSGASLHPQLMLWVAWMTIVVDSKISDDEATLMRHLVLAVDSRHQVVDEELAQVVDIDPEAVWRRLDNEPGDLTDLLAAARSVAEVDGAVNSHERALLNELEERCAARRVDATA